eukprot:4023090-Prymnesium_polylepis.1
MVFQHVQPRANYQCDRQGGNAERRTHPCFRSPKAGGQPDECKVSGSKEAHKRRVSGPKLSGTKQILVRRRSARGMNLGGAWLPIDCRSRRMGLLPLGSLPVPLAIDQQASKWRDHSDHHVWRWLRPGLECECHERQGK